MPHTFNCKLILDKTLDNVVVGAQKKRKKGSTFLFKFFKIKHKVIKYALNLHFRQAYNDQLVPDAKINVVIAISIEIICFIC